MTVTDDDGGTDTDTVDVAVAAAFEAPRFADDTGDAQSWTVGTQIAPITVPAAGGNPTPAYAAVGTLPAGIVFDTTSRVISGTPSAVDTGTITIRASNSEGDADWTVAFITSAGPLAPSFADNTGDAQDWTQGATITPITVPLANGNPAPAYAEVGTLPTGISFDKLTRVISGAPTDLGSGTVTIQAMNSEGTANWTVGYTTRAALVAPSFTDDTGDAQSWTTETAIADITVPQALGNPAPSYVAVGSLPAGIAFDTTTRVISGTPNVAGSGTITIRASNSEGNADWTVDFVTTLALTAPSFADPTGDPQVLDNQRLHHSNQCPGSGRQPHADLCGLWHLAHGYLIRRWNSGA